jgi:acetolactate synthase-1/2/3 large subunit
MSRSPTLAEALWRALEAEGVSYAFGIPGAAILPVYDAHARLAPRVRHVLVRHEQAAAHAAEGYAHATGEVAVCLATSGPGATNLVTGLADANHDRVPLVAITGNVPTAALGTGAFQEADIAAITAPVTKWSTVLRDPRDFEETIARAFHLARSGRPGPVLVDIPKDVQLAEVSGSYRPLPPARPPCPAPAALDEAARLLAEAERPLLYLGGGVRKSGAAAEARALAERLELPFATSLQGKGAVSEDHPLWLGMIGMHGHARANRAVQRADVLFAAGARLSDRGTGATDGFAPGAKLVQADLDPAALSRSVPAEVALAGDLRETLEALLARLEAMGPRRRRPARDAWRAELAGLHDESRDSSPASGGGGLGLGLLRTPDAIDRLQRRLPRGAVVTTGVGQHQMFAAQRWRATGPRDFITSGGFGTMGFCLPAAIGAQLGRPDALVVGIDGDGSFQMTLQDLATAADLGLPLKLFVLNNQALGLVRQMQRLFLDRRFAATSLSARPDFAAVAEAFGCLGLRAGNAEELDAAIERALAHEGGPAVVDVRVCPEVDVLPMVPAGKTLSEMIGA